MIEELAPAADAAVFDLPFGDINIKLFNHVLFTGVGKYIDLVNIEIGVKYLNIGIELSGSNYTCYLSYNVAGYWEKLPVIPPGASDMSKRDLTDFICNLQSFINSIRAQS